MGDYDSMAPGIMKGIYNVIGPQIKRRQVLEDELRSQRANAIYKHIETTPNLMEEEIDKYLTEIESLYPKNVREIIKASHDKIRQIQLLGKQYKEKQATAQADAQKAQANAVFTDKQPATSPMPTMPSAQANATTPTTGFVGAGLLSPTMGQPTSIGPIAPPPSIESDTNANPMTGAEESSNAVVPTAPEFKTTVPESAIAPPPSATAELFAKSGNVNRSAKINREAIAESMDYWRTKLPNADDNTLYNIAAGKQILPSALKVLGTYDGKDGFKHVMVLPAGATEPTDLKSTEQVKEKIFRPVPRGDLSVAEAIKEQEKGRIFEDQDGNAIEVKKLDPSLKLLYWESGSKHHYSVAQQTQTTKDISGRIIGKNQYDITDPSAGNVLGQATSTLPRTTSREQITMTPEGQPVAQTLVGGRATVMPALPGRSEQPANTPANAPANIPTGVPAGTPTTAPTTTPAVSGQPAPTSPVKPTTKAEQIAASNTPLPAGTRAIGGMPTTIYNTQQKRIVAIREASNQIFGDPSQPDFVPLKAYASMASKPDSAQRVGAAVQATLKSIEYDEKAHGSMINLLKTYANVPQALVNAKTAQMQDIIPTDPAEHAAYTATINAYSNLVGLRMLTGAGAYEFSVKAIQQELPILGLNVHDEKQFYGMLTKLAEDIWGGARTTVKGMFPQNEVDHYKSQVSEMSRMARGGIGAPPGAGNTSKPKVIEYDANGKRK